MGTFIKATPVYHDGSFFVNLDLVQAVFRKPGEEITYLCYGPDDEYGVRETPEALLGLGNPPAAPEKVDPRKQPLETLADRIAPYDCYISKRFRHYKTGDVYRLRGVAVNESDQELVAVYQPEMPEINAPLFVRPATEFFGVVFFGVTGGTVRRFDPVPEGESRGTV